jgi:predicted ATPase
MKLKQIRVDGYKNLIDCEVNLGDFNVLVGPNNSGKSNFLELFRILEGFCFGNDEVREALLTGLLPYTRLSVSVCHLKAHKRKPLTIGINFEILIQQEKWNVDYEIKVKCSRPKKSKGRFLEERLSAKIVGRKGPRTEYIRRTEKQLIVYVSGTKKVPHPISANNISLQAIRSLYPDHEGLPSEFQHFYKAINQIAGMRTFAFSPQGLREKYDEEQDIKGLRISSFDLLLILDKLKEETKYLDLFKETMCHILDLEEVHFDVEEIKISPGKKGEEISKRSLYLFIKRQGDSWSWFQEYSDGTFLVAAILASLFSEHDRGPILCLEELENCLHPAAIEKLLRFLQDNADKWPALITTHSSYLLNGVKPEDVNVAVVDETGAAHFEKIKNNRELRDYLNKGLMSFGDLLADNYKRFRE